MRLAKWSRRHRGLVAASAVVLVVGSASLAVGAVRLANEQLNTRRALEKATATREPVTVIAYAVGYEDLAVFRQAFRRRFGVSPHEYATGSRAARPSGSARSGRRGG